MGLSVCLAAAAVVATNFFSPEVGYFPGSFFESKAKAHLQRRAMVQWPGPSQIVARWESGDLESQEMVAVLLGMAASHDPVLLPLYRKAVLSADDRVRMAAAYGYRNLLGDAQPNLANGIDLRVAEQLAAEIDAVSRTLRERPLIEFWLQAALMGEGGSMPGWRGVVLRRPQSVCLRAVEQILELDDFQYLSTAYRRAEGRSLRIGLMRLIEAITLQQFFTAPADGRTGWGAKDMDEALEAADAFVEYWVDTQCTTKPTRVLWGTMGAMGVRGVQPMATNSYDFWLQLLKLGSPQWRMMAARRLYQLGGMWSQLTVFQSDSKSQAEEIDVLLEWYRLRPAHLQNRRSQAPPPRP